MMATLRTYPTLMSLERRKQKCYFSKIFYNENFCVRIKKKKHRGEGEADGWQPFPKLTQMMLDMTFTVSGTYEHRRPRLKLRSPSQIESCLNLHFIRECRGMHKTRPKILSFVNIQNENKLTCVCVVSFTVCSLLEPFGSRFGEF